MLLLPTIWRDHVLVAHGRRGNCEVYSCGLWNTIAHCWTLRILARGWPTYHNIHTSLWITHSFTVNVGLAQARPNYGIYHTPLDLLPFSILFQPQCHKLDCPSIPPPLPVSPSPSLLALTIRHTKCTQPMSNQEGISKSFTNRIMLCGLS